MNKKINKLVSILLLPFSVSFLNGCSKENTQQLTMYVGLGNTSGSYYKELHEAILENTGIDVKYVYSSLADTTNAINNSLINNDLPADIVITAAATEEDIQQDCFLDLTTYTNIPNYFLPTKLNDVDINGHVYQLPFTSRLIGIEYNKTLMEENHWELPTSFSELVSLKQKCEAAGYNFSVSGNVATGHGFNYLMNFIGTNYLSSPKGSYWLKKYLNGEATIDEFANECEYFKKLKDAGIFGYVYTSDWNHESFFAKTRSLICINQINSCYSYEGYKYDMNNHIEGAIYNGEELQVTYDNQGDTVYFNKQYVHYDESNPEHKELERFFIDGNTTYLHDEYGSMPWISENGNSNCYVSYDCMYLALDKDLAKESNKDKLEKATKVLEFMASDKAVKLFTDMYPDGYVSTSDFTIEEDRLYYDCIDYVKGGYTMPWYYNKFNVDTIVNVGQSVNDYLQDKDSSISKITNTLDTENNNRLNNIEESLGEVEEDLSYSDTAKALALASALEYEKQTTVDVSLMPYINSLEEIPYAVKLPVVQSKIYKGSFKSSLFGSYCPNTSGSILVELSGKETKELINSGFDASIDYNTDKSYPYLALIKNNIDLSDTQTYRVIIPRKCISNDRYNELLNANKIYVDSSKAVVNIKYETALETLGNKFNKINKNISWSN